MSSTGLRDNQNDDSRAVQELYMQLNNFLDLKCGHLFSVYASATNFICICDSVIKT